MIEAGSWNLTVTGLTYGRTIPLFFYNNFSESSEAIVREHAPGRTWTNRMQAVEMALGSIIDSRFVPDEFSGAPVLLATSVESVGEARADAAIAKAREDELVGYLKARTWPNAIFAAPNGTSPILTALTEILDELGEQGGGVNRHVASIDIRATWRAATGGNPLSDGASDCHCAH